MRSALVVLALGTLAALVAAGPATAQPALVWTTSIDSTRYLGELGRGNDPLPDFDGDGTPDVLTNVYFSAGAGIRSRAVVLSGATGAVLGMRDSLVFVTPSPDLDGDGVPEVWALAGEGEGYAYALVSGASLLSGTPTPLLTRFTRPGSAGFLTTGSDVLASGLDATGDGVPDLVGLHSGRVWLYSGAALASGAATAVRSFAPPDAEAYFEAGRNSQLALVPDINGDGAADLLVSDPAFEPPGPDPNAGVVYAFSGATGDLLHRWLRTGSEQGRIALAFGDYGLAAIGGPPNSGPGAGADLDGDGVPDLLIGSMDFTEPLSILGGIHAYSGATGARIRRYDMPEPTWFAEFGANLRVVPDGDGDGVADIATAVNFNGSEAEQYGPHGVLVVSSATGAELWRVEDPTGEEDAGVPPSFSRSYLAGVADGAGGVRLFVSAPYADAESQVDAGVVYAFARLPVAGDGGSSPVSLPALRVSVTPNPAHSSASLTLTLGEASWVAVTVVDALGRVVRRVEAGALAAGAHRLALDVGGLPAGVYVVHAETAEATSTARITVTR